MSMGPDKVPVVWDLFTYNGTAGLGTTTGTKAYDAVKLPQGKKAVQIALVTSATVTLNIQNSVDGSNWASLFISTNSSTIFQTEDNDIIPYWRLNVTSHSTSGTGSSAAMVAKLAYAVPK